MGPADLASTVRLACCVIAFSVKCFWRGGLHDGQPLHFHVQGFKVQVGKLLIDLGYLDTSSAETINPPPPHLYYKPFKCSFHSRMALNAVVLVTVSLFVRGGDPSSR